jgi:hypothetical protein
MGRRSLIYKGFRNRRDCRDDEICAHCRRSRNTAESEKDSNIVFMFFS